MFMLPTKCDLSLARIFLHLSSDLCDSLVLNYINNVLANRGLHILNAIQAGFIYLMPFKQLNGIKYMIFKR